MSVELMGWAFKQDIRPGPKLVLLSLADHANGHTRLCIPGQKAIAEQCSMSVRTVQRHLETLEASGLITREARMRGEGRGRTSDRYYLNDQRDNPAPTRQVDKTNATNQDDQHDTVGVAEPEENRKEEPIAAAPRQAPAKKTKEPDLLFEAIAKACGIDIKQLTGTSRGQLNKATKELRDIGATPDQVAGKAQAWRSQYENASLTPTALVKHWPSLAEQEKRASRKSIWDTYDPPERYYA